jgi:signal transduction histidine kinase
VTDLAFDPQAAEERIARGQGTATDHHTVAVHFYRRGDLASALASVELARSLGAKGAAPLYLKGLVLEELGHLEQAEAALVQAAAEADRDTLRAKALSTLGVVRCRRGDARAALEPLSVACTLRPELREARHNLGVAAVRAREWGVAAEAFLRLALEEPARRAQENTMRLLFDVGRASAFDEMRAQGHRLKNLVGLLGDKAQKTAPALTPDVTALFEQMKAYLDAMREEPLELDLLDVNALVSRCVFALSSSFGSIRVEKRLADGLPEIVGDRASLEESVTNVLRNAIEALREAPPATGDEPDIVVVTTVRGIDARNVCIEVRDRGPGLDPADIQRIFMLGFTTKPRGSGIGLTQVRKMVRAHGGEVEAEGQKGRGAVFRIVLPTSPPPGPSLPRLDVRSPLFESLGDLVAGSPE